MKRYLLVANEKKRRAISEIMGTLMMVAVTLVAGAAVFGFVNNQAAISESQYGESVAKNVNYLNEHFVIVNVQFPSSNCSGTYPNRFCNEMRVYIYNNGAVDDVLNSITITNDMSVTEAQIGNTNLGPWCVPFPHCDISPSLLTTTISRGPTVLPLLFTVTLPTDASSCTSVLCFKVGSYYTVQVTGIYGNVVTLQTTVNG